MANLDALQFQCQWHFINFIMFRQQQIDCNCTLFPHQQIPYLQCRSPQPFQTYRKENRSKKSLKYHSNSRTKKLNNIIPLKESLQQGITNDTNNYQLNRQNHNDKNSGNSKNKGQDRTFPITHKNFPPKQRVQISHYKQKSKDAFELNKQNIHCHMRTPTQPNLQACTPLHSINLNEAQTGKKNAPLNFYKNSHEIRPITYKCMEINSPALDKMHSTTTTLTESIGPFHFQQSKTKLQRTQKQPIRNRQTLNQPLSINNCALIQDYDNFVHKEPLKSLPIDSINFGQALPKNKNTFILSRLGQIMSEREQAQSIYPQGQKPDDNSQDQFQSSRVIISCKKLMQDNNGILQLSDQAKLFDYDKPNHVNTNNKGEKNKTYVHNVFEKISKI